jgi:hypothetical protein
MLNRLLVRETGRCAVPFGDYPPLRPKKQNGRMVASKPVLYIALGAVPATTPASFPFGPFRGAEKVHPKGLFFASFSHFQVERSGGL